MGVIMIISRMISDTAGNCSECTNATFRYKPPGKLELNMTSVLSKPYRTLDWTRAHPRVDKKNTEFSIVVPKNMKVI